MALRYSDNLPKFLGMDPLDQYNEYVLSKFDIMYKSIANVKINNLFLIRPRRSKNYNAK